MVLDRFLLHVCIIVIIEKKEEDDLGSLRLVLGFVGLGERESFAFSTV